CKSAAIQHNIVAISLHGVIVRRPHEILILLILVQERISCALDGSILVRGFTACLTYCVIKQADELLFVLDNLAAKWVASTLNFCKLSLFLPKLRIASKLRLSGFNPKSVKYQFAGHSLFIDS